MSPFTRLWTLVLAVLILPFAALGDLAYEGPPNDYIGFLFRHGYYRGGGVTNFISSFGIPLAFAMAGGFVLVVAKFLLSTANKRVKVVVSCLLVVFLVFVTSLLVVQITNESKTMVEVSLFRGWPEKTYRDTPKHRSEYDAHCLQIYETWSYSGGKWYAFNRDVPTPRPDAPTEVKEAYQRLRARAADSIHLNDLRDAGNEGMDHVPGGE